jgi:hypothetical protein
VGAITGTLTLWGVLALASLPLYFGLRRMVPGLMALPWWLLAVGIGTVVLAAVWGSEVNYLAGKYAVTTLLMLGLPALAMSLSRKK